MNPYLDAFQDYHSQGEPWIAWTDAIDFHMQYGRIFSTEKAFLMARRVEPDLADEFHPTLTEPPKEGNHWHVWAAGGDLSELLRLAFMNGADVVTFQRRDCRLHRTTVDRLRRLHGR